MTAQHTNGTGHGEQSATIGIGGTTSGEQGATPDHETMAETGGSGGDALTKPRREEAAPATPSATRQDEATDEADAEGADTAATAIARGAQDTRSRQASPGDTGLGTPETGGNQSERDLAPPRPR
ncbi:hypothetical protein QPK32_12495 [Massilia sp. YIM B02763]|uniref:hypothetical protein n=1 Tax=Massilia sp. YIM B02763 TaxID=3050130 RepID=UPI0025B6D3AB|nr:hypothetical protein [Massilia sp. YIM B02763]MDN4053898.1 hypothetical protein [Massilia sp. YIM B02763]